MVIKWRKRYQEAGLEGLSDLRRSGAPRKLDKAKIKETLTLTTQRVPRKATHWSLRLMAKYAGVSIWQVARVAGEASPFQAALHADQCLMAERHGGLVYAAGKTGALS